MSLYNLKKPITRLVMWSTCDNPKHHPTHDPRDYSPACTHVRWHMMAESRWKKLWPQWKAADKLPDPCPCRECKQERREAARSCIVWEGA